MLANQTVQLGYELHPGAGLELSLDALLEHEQPALLELLRGGVRERLVEDVGERRSAPQLQRRIEALVAHEALEPVEIERVGLDLQQVSG